MTDDHDPERELFELTQALPGLYFRFSRDGRFVAVHGADVQDLLEEPDAFLGRHFEDVLPPEVASALAAAIERSRASGRTEVFEYDLDIGGKRSHFEARVAHARDSGETVSLVQNISAREVSEARLRESALRLRAIIDTAMDGIITIRADGTIETINAATERIFGYSAAELAGRNVSMLMPEAEGSRHDDYMQRYLESREARIIGSRREVEGLRKDGVRFPLELSVAPVELEGTTIFTGILRDLSERKAAEEERDRFFIMSLDLLCVANLEGYFVRVNPAFEAAFGYSREELLARPFMEFIHPEDHAATLAEMEKLASGARTLQFENRYLCKDGSLKWIQWNTVPVPETGLLYAAARDVTAMKETQRQLALARDSALEASRFKSQFLANMSHEIRTPMNGILGMIELVLMTELSPEQQEYVLLARNSAESLLSLLNDILDYSKVEAGKLDLHVIDFDLESLVADTVKGLALRAQDKGLEVLLALDEDVPRALLGDPNRVRQVLVNLVGNAIKFCDAGEILVAVSVEELDREQVVLRFRVRDTGCGIAADMQEGIFDSFVQADGSTTRKHGGSGLGLSISSQLVQLMGGRIWVESAVGAGSTFQFTARFGLGPARVDAPDERADRDGRLAGLRVLAVDDNETNLEIVATMLAAWGCEVVRRSGGEEALLALQSAKAASRPYDVVVSDVQMPGMDGAALAERMRADPATRETPIVFLSSLATREDPARSGTLEPAVSLAKPVRRQELEAALLRLLARRTTGASSTRRAMDEGPTLRGARILLAEDNDTNRLLVTRLVQKRAGEVVLAGNGREAIRLFREGGRFDVILMDMQMPEMGGVEATRAIRAIEDEAGDSRRVPIVAMTANARADDRRTCLAAGMDDHIAKPLRADALYAMIRRFFPE